MWRNNGPNPALAAQGGTAIACLPALAGAAVCVGCTQSGILGFLFLLPFGVMAFWYNKNTAWFCGFLAALGHTVLSLGISLFSGQGQRFGLLNIGYFILIAAGFLWIMAPPSRGGRFLRMPAVYRVILASVAGAAALIPLLGDVYPQLRSQAEFFASLYTAAAEADAVQRSLAEQYITPETILETARFLALRGGAVAAYMILFGFTRQFAAVLALLFRRGRAGPSITCFQAPASIIWALSCSLLGIVLGQITRLAPLEIPAWNVLVICGILYLVQGWGILAYFLSRLRPLGRLLLNLFMVFLVASPGINTVFLGALIFLGIAEHWAPFRTPKHNGPSSSTPGT